MDEEKFTLKSTSGGVGGAHLLIMRGERYVGHLYFDYEIEKDMDDLIELITGEKECRV